MGKLNKYIIIYLMSNNQDKKKTLNRIPRINSKVSIISTGTETPAYPILQLIKRAAASETDQASTMAGTQQSTAKPKDENKSTLKFLDKILPQWFLNKTEVCKHNHGCF